MGLWNKYTSALGLAHPRGRWPAVPADAAWHPWAAGIAAREPAAPIMPPRYPVRRPP